MNQWNRRDFVQAASAAGAAWFATSASGNGSTAKPSRFLEGNFAPVIEEVAADNLPVKGSLPAGLEGMFVRNGPNPQFAPIGQYHWFDGDGMLHGVRLASGRASYRNRYVQTAGYQAEKRAGKALWGGLLDPPALERLAEGKSPYKNAANTALIWHHGKLLALWEGGEPHEVRLPSLETAGPYDFGGKLRHNFTAHPKVDPATGEMMFFGYSPFPPFLRYSVADANGVISRTIPVPLRHPVMMHDFAVTERYSIFLDLPETFRVNPKEKGALQFRYQPELGARIGVLPRHGASDDVRWFEIKPCYVFHTLGAHEEGTRVVVLGCRMEDFPEEIETGRPPSNRGPNDPPPGRPLLHRWTIDLAAGTVKEESLDDRAAEFPRQREDRMGRPARYGYLMRQAMDAILKYDLEKGTTDVHEHGPGRFGGEAVFVPRAGGTEEDDGWLLTYVFDAASGRSELVVVDAREVASPPAARILLPTRVPFGFHGAWIAEGPTWPAA